MVEKTLRQIKQISVVVTLSLFVLLAGCATGPTKTPPVVGPGSEDTETTKPDTDKDVDKDKEEKEKKDKKKKKKDKQEKVEIDSDSPAYGLLQRAQSARQNGEYPAAGRFLERALTFAEPSEAAVLYREFGELRMAEGQSKQAEGMFLRALRDAPKNYQWQAELWNQIKAVRTEQGDEAGATAADDRAQQLLEL